MPYLGIEDGVELFYTDEGTGDPVLLVHGWACDSQDWMWLIPALAPTYRVIAVDLRGHGRSSVPKDGFSPPTFAADLAALIDTLVGGPVAIVGHSLGTVVASTIAVERPELVKGMVLVDPVYGIPAELVPLMEVTIRAFELTDPVDVTVGAFSFFYTEQTPPHLPVWHRRRIQGMPPHVVAQTLANIYTGPDVWAIGDATAEYLKQRRAPVLALYADEARAAVERSVLPDDGSSRIELWPGAGHFMHQERPDEFNALALEWLRKLGKL